MVEIVQILLCHAHCSSMQYAINLTQSQQREQFDDNLLIFLRQLIETDDFFERQNSVIRKCHNDDWYFSGPQYDHVNPRTDECWQRTPEFVLFGKCFVKIGIFTARFRHWKIHFFSFKFHVHSCLVYAPSTHLSPTSLNVVGWCLFERVTSVCRIKSLDIPTVPNSAKHKAPSSDITPHPAHTTKQSPKLPEYFNASVGDTKMPEPIITPMIMLMAPIRPMLRLRPTSSTSGTFFSIFVTETNRFQEIYIYENSTCGYATI